LIADGSDLVRSERAALAVALCTESFEKILGPLFHSLVDLVQPDFCSRRSKSFAAREIGSEGYPTDLICLFHRDFLPHEDIFGEGDVIERIVLPLTV